MRYFARILVVLAICCMLSSSYDTLAQTRRGKPAASAKPKKKKPKKKKMPAKTETVTAKQWGGRGVALNLEAEANAFTIEFDCAHGTLKQPLTLDAEGRFDVPGTFTPEHGGPIRSDEPDRTRPARYTGQVKGNTMTLNILLESGKPALGPFELKANVTGRLFKCL